MWPKVQERIRGRWGGDSVRPSADALRVVPSKTLFGFKKEEKPLVVRDTIARKPQHFIFFRPKYYVPGDKN